MTPSILDTPIPKWMPKIDIEKELVEEMFETHKIKSPSLKMFVVSYKSEMISRMRIWGIEGGDE